MADRILTVAEVEEIAVRNGRSVEHKSQPRQDIADLIATLRYKEMANAKATPGA